MHKTLKRFGVESGKKLAVTTDELQEMLGCGRYTACQIGLKAEARMQLGKRVLWNVHKVKAYLESISGNGNVETDTIR